MWSKMAKRLHVRPHVISEGVEAFTGKNDMETYWDRQSMRMRENYASFVKGSFFFKQVGRAET